LRTRIHIYYFQSINFAQGNAIIDRNVTHSEVQKDIRLKICKTLTLRTLLYGYETWAVIEQDKHRITSAEMKILRRMLKYVWQD
jgi:hypothetical protein